MPLGVGDPPNSIDVDEPDTRRLLSAADFLAERSSRNRRARMSFFFPFGIGVSIPLDGIEESLWAPL